MSEAVARHGSPGCALLGLRRASLRALTSAAGGAALCPPAVSGEPERQHQPRVGV